MSKELGQGPQRRKDERHSGQDSYSTGYGYESQHTLFTPEYLRHV